MTTARFDAIVFDMDGTLISSEGIYEAAWMTLLARRGQTLTHESYERHFAGVANRACAEGYRLHDALGAAMDLARRANGYVEEREPWAQAKDPARASELDETLATLARALAALAAFLQPVCPSRMAELASRLGLTEIGRAHV